ncbi:hypothetical protein D3C74_02470 [compost metagenome]
MFSIQTKIENDDYYQAKNIDPSTISLDLEKDVSIQQILYFSKDYLYTPHHIESHQPLHS